MPAPSSGKEAGKRLEQRLKPRVVVHAGNPLEPVGGDHVDVARISQPRHRDLCDPGRDLVAVERGREQLAGLGEKPQPVVGALPIGDLHDQAADADRLVVGGADRVVAREPVTLLADVKRCVVGGFGVHDRLARLEHLPVERFERRGKGRDHLAEGLADVLLGREPVQGGKRVVHADEAEVAVPEADPDRRGAKHGVELGVGLLGGLEEECVVDCERGAPGDLVRELEVGGAEPAARLTRPEGDRAEQAPACLERDDDVRNRTEGLVEREVLLVDRGAGQSGVAGVLDEVRLAGPHDLAHRVGFVRLGRVAAPELAQQLRALVAAVRDHHLPQGGVLVERIDDAVVGDPRDEQPSQIGQRRLVVQRRGEQRARLGEKVEPSFGVALLGDVSEDVDHELDAAVGRQNRRRADDRPALVTARA